MTDDGVVSLDDLRMSREQRHQLAMHNVLIHHQPLHRSARDGDEGPITNCMCGALQLGDSWAWHLAGVLIAQGLA